MDLTAQRLFVQVAAQEDRLDRFAQLGQCLVGRMHRGSAGEAKQNGFRVRRAQLQGRCVLDDLVVLLGDQIPLDRACQDWFKVRILLGVVGADHSQFLPSDQLEAWQQVKAQDVAEGERDFALAVRVDILLRDLHVGAVTQHAFHHSRHFG